MANSLRDTQKSTVQRISSLTEAILFRLKKDGIGCLSETINKLTSIDPDSDISSQELASIILEDYGLISKVLHTVNSFYYNRLGQKISTVTQAVVLLGFNSIREIALGMAVMDLLPEGNNSVAVKLMAEAFVAAHVAQELAAGVSKRAPEEVFLAALFRPLARIVTAIHDPDLYLKIAEVERNGTEEDKRAVRRLWRNIGRNLSHVWMLPPSTSEHMEACIPRKGYQDPQIHQLVKDSHFLVSRIFSREETIDPVFEIKKVARRYRIVPRELFGKIEKAVDRTGSYSSSFRMILLGDDVMKSLKEELNAAEPESCEEVSLERKAVDEDIRDQEELFLDLLNQMSSAIMQHQLSLDQVYLMAAETLQRGVILDRVLLCLLTVDRRTLLARYGLGLGVKSIKEKLRIPFPVKVPPLSTAFRQNKEVVGTWGQIPLVGGTRDDELDSKLVCVSPLVIQGRPIGCFLLDRAVTGDRFQPKDLKRVAAIRQLVVMATRQRASG